jgi:hypothetical protein
MPASARNARSCSSTPHLQPLTGSNAGLAGGSRAWPAPTKAHCVQSPVGRITPLALSAIGPSSEAADKAFRFMRPT